MKNDYDYKPEDDIHVLGFPGDEVLILNPQRCSTTVTIAKGSHPSSDVIAISLFSNDESRTERSAVMIDDPAKLDKLIQSLMRLGKEIWGIDRILEQTKN